MNLLSVPVYYIAFSPNVVLERDLKRFGFRDVRHFQAINGKALDLSTLRLNKVIGDMVTYDLKHGRCKELSLPSYGAIGCYLSHYSIMKEVKDNRIPFAIILEDDVTIDYQKLAKKFKQLEKSLDDLYTVKPRSIVTFDTSSASVVYSTGRSVLEPFDAQIDLLKTFVLFHMYMVSREFCDAVLEYMLPIEMQVDNVFPLLKEHLDINLAGTVDHFASQKKHKSSIQKWNKNVYKVKLPHSNWFYRCLIVFILLLLVLVFCLGRRKCVY